MAGLGETSRSGFPPEGETGKGAIKPPCCRRHLLAHYARIPPAYALPASPYGHSKARIPTISAASAPEKSLKTSSNSIASVLKFDWSFGSTRDIRTAVIHSLASVACTAVLPAVNVLAGMCFRSVTVHLVENRRTEWPRTPPGRTMYR